MGETLVHGDCREVLRNLPAGSIEACVTDPPYHLVSIVKRFGASNAAPAKAGATGVYARSSAGFMGQQWDGGDVAFQVDTWREVFRVLKPGSHLVAFGGTRTYHRMVCAIEDAGFEIRDQIGWVYGSGFPKSHNLDGDWEGWGTALKPAWEPIVVARKPLIGTVAANVEAHGVGAINIDGCRVHSEDAQGGDYTVKRLKPGATLNATGGNWRPEEGPLFHGEMKPCRWPANLIHDGSDEVLALFPIAPGQLAKASSNPSSPRTLNVYGALARSDAPMTPRGDTGSAARFFYVAKASRADRGPANGHPTVKPTTLMRYLCRLVTPPDGTVLDPFMGSGSTGRGAVLEGFNFIGVEQSGEYLSIAQARIEEAVFGDCL